MGCGSKEAFEAQLRTKRNAGRTLVAGGCCHGTRPTLTECLDAVAAREKLRHEGSLRPNERRDGLGAARFHGHERA